jgi:hypothetical protein
MLTKKCLVLNRIIPAKRVQELPPAKLGGRHSDQPDWGVNA